MKIEVELVGPMKRPWPERSRDLELAKGSSIGDLLRALGYSDEEARHLTCSVNGAAVRLRSPLEDGDRVMVMLMLGGG